MVDRDFLEKNIGGNARRKLWTLTNVGIRDIPIKLKLIRSETLRHISDDDI